MEFMNNIGAHRLACQRQIKTYSGETEGEGKQSRQKEEKNASAVFVISHTGRVRMTTELMPRDDGGGLRE